jgi:SRSO17 transposase
LSTTNREDQPITGTMPSPLPNFDEAVWQQFEHFVAGLRGTFHRSDQFQRFRAYLRALLEPCERKNIESLAASASSVMAVEANLPQAFQHFVSQSPWNPDRLLEATRANQERSPNADSTVWVVHDAVFSKKGKHSVGVQRQFARSEGKKLNCQIGVVVAQWNAEEYLPLACRLYIPTTWLKENEETARRSIPEEYRRGSSKGEIALELLDRLKAELQVAPTFIAEEGYHGTHAFVEGLAQRSAGRSSGSNGSKSIWDSITSKGGPGRAGTTTSHLCLSPTAFWFRGS